MIENDQVVMWIGIGFLVFAVGGAVWHGAKRPRRCVFCGDCRWEGATKDEFDLVGPDCLNPANDYLPDYTEPKGQPPRHQPCHYVNKYGRCTHFKLAGVPLLQCPEVIRVRDLRPIGGGKCDENDRSPQTQVESDAASVHSAT